MLEKIFTKEHIFIVIIICILCVFEVQIGSMILYDDVLYQQEDTISSLCNVQNYQVQDRTYTVMGEDPQLLFRVNIPCIDTVRMEFAEPISKDTVWTIYYDDGSGLNESSAVTGLIENGVENAELSLPRGEYQYVRLDIDGDFSVKNIFFEGNTVRLNHIKFIFYIIFCLSLNLLVWFMRREVLKKWNAFNERQKNYVIVLLFMCALMIIFYRSFYWPDETFFKRKMIAIGISCLGIVVLPLLLVKNKNLNYRITEFRNAFWGKAKDVKKLISCIVRWGCAILVLFSISRFLAKVIGVITDKGYNHYLFYFIFTLLILAFLVVKMRCLSEKRVEIIFLAVIVLIGGLMIRISPAMVGVSWDDQIHYNRTLSLSNYLSGFYYSADIQIMQDCVTNAIEHRYYDRQTQNQYYQQLGTSYDEREYCLYEDTSIGISSIAYIPSAIGIVLARGLGLSWVYTFMMGKFFNLLMYALLIYYAIKKLSYGKVLTAVIGLIPTTVFMACSYSYDPWVIGFTILGYAHFFSIIQKPERKFEIKDIITIVVFLVIGCMPKAVYFPLLLPLFFVSKRKFFDSQRIKCYSVVLMGILVLLLSFVLPIFLNGAGAGDARGGADVNASLQIQFILQHPIQYTKILLRFLRDYTTIENFQSYFQHFAYMGQGKYYGLCFLILCITAVLDKSGKEVSEKILYFSVYFSGFAVLVFVATALYVDFTAVAADTVAGCQYRYITPVLFPILYCIGSEKVKYCGNKSLFTYVPILIMVALSLDNIFRFCVMPY